MGATDCTPSTYKRKLITHKVVNPVRMSAYSASAAVPWQRQFLRLRLQGGCHGVWPGFLPTRLCRLIKRQVREFPQQIRMRRHDLLFLRFIQIRKWVLRTIAPWYARRNWRDMTAAGRKRANQSGANRPRL
jgi:hypothetical protein